VVRFTVKYVGIPDVSVILIPSQLLAGNADKLKDVTDESDVVAVMSDASKLVPVVVGELVLSCMLNTQLTSEDTYASTLSAVSLISNWGPGT